MGLTKKEEIETHASKPSAFHSPDEASSTNRPLYSTGASSRDLSNTLISGHDEDILKLFPPSFVPDLLSIESNSPLFYDLMAADNLESFVERLSHSDGRDTSAIATESTPHLAFQSHPFSGHPNVGSLFSDSYGSTVLNGAQDDPSTMKARSPRLIEKIQSLKRNRAVSNSLSSTPITPENPKLPKFGACGHTPNDLSFPTQFLTIDTLNVSSSADQRWPPTNSNLDSHMDSVLPGTSGSSFTPYSDPISSNSPPVGGSPSSSSSIKIVKFHRASKDPESFQFKTSGTDLIKKHISHQSPPLTPTQDNTNYTNTKSNNNNNNHNYNRNYSTDVSNSGGTDTFGIPRSTDITMTLVEGFLVPPPIPQNGGKGNNKRLPQHSIEVLNLEETMAKLESQLNNALAEKGLSPMSLTVDDNIQVLVQCVGFNKLKRGKTKSKIKTVPEEEQAVTYPPIQMDGFPFSLAVNTPQQLRCPATSPSVSSLKGGSDGTTPSPSADLKSLKREEKVVIEVLEEVTTRTSLDHNGTFSRMVISPEYPNNQSKMRADFFDIIINEASANHGGRFFLRFLLLVTDLPGALIDSSDTFRSVIGTLDSAEFKTRTPRGWSKNLEKQSSLLSPAQVASPKSPGSDESTPSTPASNSAYSRLGPYQGSSVESGPPSSSFTASPSPGLIEDDDSFIVESIEPTMGRLRGKDPVKIKTSKPLPGLHAVLIVMFGEVPSRCIVTMKKNFVVCETPPQFEQASSGGNLTVPVRISLNAGQTFSATRASFTYTNDENLLSQAATAAEVSALVPAPSLKLTQSQQSSSKPPKSNLFDVLFTMGAPSKPQQPALQESSFSPPHHAVQTQGGTSVRNQFSISGQSHNNVSQHQPGFDHSIPLGWNVPFETLSQQEMDSLVGYLQTSYLSENNFDTQQPNPGWHPHGDSSSTSFGQYNQRVAQSEPAPSTMDQLLQSQYQQQRLMTYQQHLYSQQMAQPEMRHQQHIQQNTQETQSNPPSNPLLSQLHHLL